ncbi:hypothetical protein F5887DRAFT_1083259 [Amanita rubescens]|nr:hypothetical protein F5887DRAFT_1083259 [Amanita rubescens]
MNQDLLRNRNVNSPLGPFDGRVAAIDPSRPNWYISSPNCDYIPLPPGTRCNVYARYDGRFGPDDHTQWPQPFLPKFPHLCCIPKKKEAPREHSVMWQDPVRAEFIRIESNVPGFGRWSEWWLEEFCKSCKWLLEELARRRANNKNLDSHPEVAPLSTNLERALSRLRAVPMGYRGAMISLRLVQRLWLELYALIEYVDRYLPSMEGRAPRATQVADVIGCFVHTAYSAEQLFAAGIPYWFVREVHRFDKENILSIDTVVIPGDLLVTEDHAGYAPRIYQGDPNVNRYLAICNYSLKHMRYADPFAGGLPNGISPADFAQSISQAGPHRAGSVRTHANSFQPYQKSSGGNSGRNKFEMINSPYMPFCLDAWRDALRAVDIRKVRLYFHGKLNVNDGRYAFPEPGIFCSGDNDARRNKYLTVWEILRPVFISRMSSGLGSVTLLSNEQWRILLAGREGNSRTKRGSARISINELLSPDAIDVGVELSEIQSAKAREYSIPEAQKLLWELSELSFRFDLIMLDRKALAARQLENNSHNQRLLSPLSREALILACFPFTPSHPRHLAFVHPEHARCGLASRALRDRLPYLNSLRRVMGEWDGFETHQIGRLEIPREGYPEVELIHYEKAITHFYTQSYFRFFGRAAIVPMYLEQ